MAEDVRQIYEVLVKSGLTKKDAAKQAQQKTGISLVTGRTITKKLGFKQSGKVSSYGGTFVNSRGNIFGL